MSEPFRKQEQGYAVESGTSCKAGKIDYSIATNNDQGIVLLEDGTLMIHNHGTSQELCGKNISDDKTPAKTIDAVNGDIFIRARNGTIILEAANIRLVGVDGKGGEITISASKQVNIKSPTVTADGTNITIAAAQNASVAGTTASVTAHTQAEVQSGIDADKSSLLGQILDAITRFKKFFSSICEDKPGG